MFYLTKLKINALIVYILNVISIVSFFVTTFFIGEISSSILMYMVLAFIFLFSLFFLILIIRSFKSNKDIFETLLFESDKRINKVFLIMVIVCLVIGLALLGGGIYVFVIKNYAAAYSMLSTSVFILLNCCLYFSSLLIYKSNQIF